MRHKKQTKKMPTIEKHIEIYKALNRNKVKYLVNRIIKQVRDVEINVISIEDLIETKKRTDRPRNKEDIEILEKILRCEL